MFNLHSPWSKLRTRSPFVVISFIALLVACGSPRAVSTQPPTSATPVPAPAATLAPLPTGTPSPTAMPAPTRTTLPSPTASPTAGIAAASVIHERSNVPILCYHQIRDWAPDEAAVDKDYIVPIKNFAAQMDFLDQQGYHTINADQLYAYLTTGAPLPPKPVMLTFDDGHGSQWTNAVPVLQKHHFQAVFFIMTITLDKPHWLSRDQIKQLDGMGMTIAAHTWDHHRVTRYKDQDWTEQITAPTNELAALVGHPIKYFAYPYGLWNKEAFPHLEQAGFAAAFQLSAKMDRAEPLMTIRRIIAAGQWSVQTFEGNLVNDF